MSSFRLIRINSKRLEEAQKNEKNTMRIEKITEKIDVGMQSHDIITGK